MVCSVALVPYYDTTPKKPWWDHGLQGLQNEPNDAARERHGNKCPQQVHEDFHASSREQLRAEQIACEEYGDRQR